MRPVISGHYKKFDVIRGLAAIAVLVTHVVVIYVARITGSDRPLFYGAEILARHAVLVFFLLSGYLITVSILLNIKKNGRFDGVHYLTSRIARIYPPLCGAMLIILVAWAVIHVSGLPGAAQYGLPTDKYIETDSFSVTVVDFIRALLMQDGLLTTDSPLWSLYAEFHIYLIAMLGAMAHCARGTWRYVWLCLGAVLFAIWSYLWVWFIFYALIWALGALAAIANNRVERVRVATRLSAGAAIVSVIALAGWLAVAQDHDAFVVNRPPLLPGFVVQALCSVCYAYLLFSSNALNRVMPQALATTGDFSYSLYVIHYPLLLLGLSLTQNWMGASMGRTLIVSVAAIPVILLLASWFARYFEDQKRFSGAIRTLLLGLRAAFSKGSVNAVERR
jgi:peptidoglycan/LPS O-acetylase OafA/YrhL